MKRSTCKKFLKLGIVFIILGFISFIGYNVATTSIFVNLLFLMFLLLPIGGIIFLIIAWLSWNSEESEERKREIHKAQLKALKKGKVNINLKSKIRKLK
ncbi:hypothetical protein KAT80_00080 [Candidatus Pacearchaeota archaeon]|nr:hypothetical protein [Candidatus Pacearchaeota archaeon]